MASVGFRILGQLEVHAAGELVRITSQRQQIFLTTLLLHPNQTVSRETLTEAIWGQRPPARPENQIAICVSALRSKLMDMGVAKTVIETRRPGYLIVLDEHELDTTLVTNRLRQAKLLATSAALPQAVAEYRAALKLWRGPVLPEVATPNLKPMITFWEELRVSTAEECFEIELQLGQHHSVTGELKSLVAQHPFRERLRGQLMTALSRAGRQTEALESYRDACRRLRDEVGLDPSTELRALNSAILRGTTDAFVPPAATQVTSAIRDFAPHMLPSDIADFTGRRDHVSSLCDALTDSHEGLERIVAICGGGGMGKSTLAVHGAHRLARAFDEGQLYVSLGGSSDQPVRPFDVLGRFIRELGGPQIAIGESLEERVGIYRTLAAGRRLLAVLDDAGDGDQIEPLLTRSGTCATIVTNRGSLGTMAGVRQIELTELNHGEAIELLERIIGVARVTNEWQAASRIVQLCDGLPLAIRICGARLAARPHWTLEQYADRMTDAGRRLDTLTHGPFNVRRAWEHSYERLESSAQKLVNLMANLDAPDFGAWVALPLLDTADSGVLELLDRIVDARLLAIAGRDETGEVRLRISRLARIYLRERAAAFETPEGIRSSLNRAFTGWLHMARIAEEALAGSGVRLRGGPEWMRLNPSLAALPANSPMPWFSREQAAIQASARQAQVWDLPMIGHELAAVEDSLTSRARHIREAADISHGVEGLSVEVDRFSGHNGHRPWRASFGIMQDSPHGAERFQNSRHTGRAADFATGWTANVP